MQALSAIALVVCHQALFLICAEWCLAYVRQSSKNLVPFPDVVMLKRKAADGRTGSCAFRCSDSRKTDRCELCWMYGRWTFLITSNLHSRERWVWGYVFWVSVTLSFGWVWRYVFWVSVTLYILGERDAMYFGWAWRCVFLVSVTLCTYFGCDAVSRRAWRCAFRVSMTLCILGECDDKYFVWEWRYLFWVSLTVSFAWVWRCVLRWAWRCIFWWARRHACWMRVTLYHWHTQRHFVTTKIFNNTALRTSNLA